MANKNKKQTYILVTILYALLTMFVVGESETSLGGRFVIVFLWLTIMALTAMIVESINS